MTERAYQKIRAGLEEALEIARGRIEGAVFSGRSILPDGDIGSHVRSMNIVYDSGVPFALVGYALCSHYGACALWVGHPDRRLMGFVIARVDRVSAALDEMAREAQELGLD